MYEFYSFLSIKSLYVSFLISLQADAALLPIVQSPLLHFFFMFEKGGVTRHVCSSVVANKVQQELFCVFSARNAG